MPISYFHQVYYCIKRLSIVYLVYQICRIVFFAANKNYFQGVGVSHLIEDCFYGLRFDTFSVVVASSLFIVMSLLPLKIFWYKKYQQGLLWLFILPNAVFLAFNLIDVAYFPFIKKRSTSELFDQMGGQSDLAKLLPRFIADFWWIILGFFLLIALIIFLYQKISINYSFREIRWSRGQKFLVWFLFCFLAALSVLGVRGGFQRVPIDIVSAGSMTRAPEVSIVLNTPFTLIKSMSQQSIPELNYFPEEEARKFYEPIHHFSHSDFKNENVVVIILESFSKEYTKLGRKQGITPFLDSLMDFSLVFKNAFSNGTKSIEGIPAVLSSMPSLMLNPFINSMYANNDQTSLATLLKAKGYETAFFHGGINGTMNFDDWAGLAGYEHYYGKNEYDNDEDFDQFWGIWDEPFLQFSILRMNEFKEPFHSAIFTLSSHHPYFLPDKVKGKFKKTDLENSESIGYADYSLAQFFKVAQKTKWFKNTLFVMVADHGGISGHPFYSNFVGNSTIPVLFYKGDNSLKGVYEPVFSQMDILPSVMDYLGYDKPFFSFGNSYKEPSGHDYFYANSIHYLFGDSTLHYFMDSKINVGYNYRRDSLLGHNIMGRDPLMDSLTTKKIRAFVQTYNNTLIHNSGRVKN